MSLLSIAKKIKEDGFDPRKDSVNGPAALPAGDYTVVLKTSTIQHCTKWMGKLRIHV